MTNLEFKINVEINLSENTKIWLNSLLSKIGSVLPETKAETKAETKSKVDLETLRTLLREKVNEHRAELKAKLNELGAANLTVLSPAKYQEMYEYLKSL